MRDDDPLRDQLTRLVEKTKGAESLDPPAYWIGDVAGERRVLDDHAAGRLDWREAHRAARLGLEELDAGNPDGALEFAWIATDYYVASLESQLRRLRPSERGLLTRSARRRGRPKKTSK
jgi:hypothetical protein